MSSMSNVASRATSAYRSDGVATASPGRLLVMLYDRFLLDLDRAEASLTSGQGAHEQLLHAQDIVMELRATLDTTVWDGAGGLASIYAFVHSELVAANVGRDAVRVAGCRALMAPLRDAWAQVVESVPDERPASPTGMVRSA